MNINRNHYSWIYNHFVHYFFAHKLTLKESRRGEAVAGLPIRMKSKKPYSRFLSLLCLLPILISACSLFTNEGDHQQERPDFGQFFQAAGVEGCFILYDRNQDTTLVYQPERVDTPYLPASTFKIFNSLVALETGVIQDENEIIPWEGVDRGVVDWNQDLDMRSAFQYSAIWFYQILARRIGPERMQQFIDRVGYGNGNIGGGIDHFWLDGDLRISARQQVDFLRRLYSNDLPFSQRSLDIVKDILIIEQTSGYTLRAKAGWVVMTEYQLGWWVGYLEQDDDVYFFALNLDIVKSGDENARMAITKEILRSLGLLEVK
jgi:beta-lactamase class D